MEAVLDLYAEPYDPKRPVVCFDERPYQMVADVHAPLPAAPGRARREDYAYERRGVCNLYMVFEPLRRRRWVRVTARRTAEDFAWQMKWLVDEVYPEADVVRVVLDNLNCHTPAALYRVFPAEEARRLVRRLEFVYTLLPRELVEYGGDRVFGVVASVFGSALVGDGLCASCGGGVGVCAGCVGLRCGLAFWGVGCA